MTGDPDVDSVNTLLHALQQEGRDPHVISHSEWLQRDDRDREQTGFVRDYLVLQDDTWARWVAS